jgi:hypothetical protein
MNGRGMVHIQRHGVSTSPASNALQHAVKQRGPPGPWGHSPRLARGGFFRCQCAQVAGWVKEAPAQTPHFRDTTSRELKLHRRGMGPRPWAAVGPLQAQPEGRHRSAVYRRPADDFNREGPLVVLPLGKRLFCVSASSGVILNAHPLKSLRPNQSGEPDSDYTPRRTQPESNKAT